MPVVALEINDHFHNMPLRETLRLYSVCARGLLILLFSLNGSAFSIARAPLFTHESSFILSEAIIANSSGHLEQYEHLDSLAKQSFPSVLHVDCLESLGTRLNLPRSLITNADSVLLFRQNLQVMLLSFRERCPWG